MQLDIDSLHSLYLGGTVALPSPFPSLGRIHFEKVGVSFPDEVESEEDFDTDEETDADEESEEEDSEEIVDGVTLHLLTVHQRLEPARTIVRAVEAAYAAAAFLPKKPGKKRVNLYEGVWVLKPLTAAKITAAAIEAGQKLENGPPRGIIFVPEHVQVLTRDEFGSTARQSADYPHYRTDGCCPWKNDGCCPWRLDGCCPWQKDSGGYTYSEVMEEP